MQDAKPPTISRSLVNYFRPFVEDTMEEDFENPIKKASFNKNDVYCIQPPPNTHETAQRNGETTLNK